MAAPAVRVSAQRAPPVAYTAARSQELAAHGGSCYKNGTVKVNMVRELNRGASAKTVLKAQWSWLVEGVGAGLFAYAVSKKLCLLCTALGKSGKGLGGKDRSKVCCNACNNHHRVEQGQVFYIQRGKKMGKGKLTTLVEDARKRLEARKMEEGC